MHERTLPRAQKKKTQAREIFNISIGTHDNIC